MCLQLSSPTLPVSHISSLAHSPIHFMARPTPHSQTEKLIIAKDQIDQYEGGDARWRGSMHGPSNLYQQWSSSLHILSASRRKSLSSKPLGENTHTHTRDAHIRAQISTERQSYLTFSSFLSRNRNIPIRTSCRDFIVIAKTRQCDIIIMIIIIKL